MKDLYGQHLLLMRQGWSSRVDLLRDEIVKKHPEIQIRDFEFYSTEIFNQCENSKDVLLPVKNWDNVHPLMKILPVDWQFEIPFGLLYAKEPSEKVRELLKALQRVQTDIV